MDREDGNIDCPPKFTVLYHNTRRHIP